MNTNVNVDVYSDGVNTRKRKRKEIGEEKEKGQCMTPPSECTPLSAYSSFSCKRRRLPSFLMESIHEQWMNNQRNENDADPCTIMTSTTTTTNDRSATKKLPFSSRIDISGPSKVVKITNIQQKPKGLTNVGIPVSKSNDIIVTAMKRKTKDLIIVGTSSDDDGVAVVLNHHIKPTSSLLSSTTTRSIKEYPRLSGEEISAFRIREKKHSQFSVVRQPYVQSFLRSRVFMHRDDAIRSMTDEEAMIFELLFHKLSADEIELIWKEAQRSFKWGIRRFAARTGSEGGNAINWNPYRNAVKYAYKKYWDKFEGNMMTDHGSRLEKTAAKIYAQTVQQHLNLWYVIQKSYATGIFEFCGVRIPLEKKKGDRYYSPPIFRCHHIAGVRDLFSHWEQVSVDGIGSINYIPLIVVEIKIPWAQECFYLYENEKMYYVPQPLDGIRMLRRLLPTIFIGERATFSHLYGINIDRFLLDPHWYHEYYIPRILRYTFGPNLTMCCEYVTKLFRHKHKDSVMNRENLQQFFQIEFCIPDKQKHRDDRDGENDNNDDDDDVEDGGGNEEKRKESTRSTRSTPQVPEKDENEYPFVIEQAEKFASSHCLFPPRKVILKSHTDYFSEARMIHWRSKTIALDEIIRKRIHSPQIPSFSILYQFNQQQPLWQDDISHFSRSLPHSTEKETQKLVHDPSAYMAMWENEQYDEVFETLEHELDLRVDFQWCVFVGGMRIVCPKPKPETYRLNTIPGGLMAYMNEKKQNKLATETYTLPSLCLTEQFRKASSASNLITSIVKE